MKIKKIVRLILCCIIVFSLSVPDAFAASTLGTTYLQQFNKLMGSKYTNDYKLTREEFCTAVSKIFIGEGSGSTNLPFKDGGKVEKKNRKYISALYKKGIVKGTKKSGNLYLYPKTKITRQEALTILGRAVSKTSKSKLTFTDADSVKSSAYGYIAWFAENGIISGNSDGSFGPTKRMTAKAASALIIKTMNYVQGVNIETVFGTGGRGHTDGNKQSGKFTLPYSILLDNNGKIIVFDTYNNAIRTIRSNKVETLTGGMEHMDENGFSKGYYSDDTVDKALLNRPSDGVLNSKGELFFVDSGNNVIRYIKENTVYTFCGTTGGFKDGTRNTAKFNNPMAIAIDKNDNLYVADTLNNCIRKIDPKGNATTIAGIADKEGYRDGSASNALFRAPAGITVNEDGSIIYVSDTGNHRIRKIENGQVTTVAGSVSQTDDGDPVGGFKDGAANKAMFNLPRGIMEADGILIVADSGNNRIRVITKSGNVITAAGNGEPGDSEGLCLAAVLNSPSGISLYKGDLYIADTGNNKIKKMRFNSNTYK